MTKVQNKTKSEIDFFHYLKVDNVKKNEKSGEKCREDLASV